MWCGYCHGRHDNEVDLMECKVHADEMDLEEPFWLPEAVTGWRGFSLTEVNGLWQLRGVKMVWPGADPGPATCNPIGTPTSSGEHKSPKVACMCGYYIVKNYEDLGNWEVEAYVEGWGDVVEHEKGYRVERIRILKLRPAGMTNLTRPITKLVAKRYGVDYDDRDWEAPQKNQERPAAEEDSST